MYKVIKSFVNVENISFTTYGIGRGNSIVVPDISSDKDYVINLVKEINKEKLMQKEVKILVEDLLD